jgi:catechol 2,3-dioxygenase-like lactoylglutathione lyase family enzyme
MISDLNSLECITLFVEDVQQSKKFYQNIFAVKPVFEDANCAVVRLENVMLNLLKISESPELIAPAKVAGPTSGSRLMFTIKVENVNTVCTKLKEHGVTLLNGPIDRPWGRRTATFSDPAGNAWEIAEEINS